MFHRINLRQTDPLSQICKEITDEVINEVAIETVPITIKTIVSSHMTLSKAADWLEDLIDETIQPMIYTVVSRVNVPVQFIWGWLHKA